jgi:hypothetical protein
MTLDLSPSESSGSRSLHRLVYFFVQGQTSKITDSIDGPRANLNVLVITQGFQC